MTWPIHGLERREMLSTMPRPTSGASRVLEQSSVTYPTPAGPGERLNVYVPPGPAPAGGRPVIIAIHGGGWRRLGKAGYGDRIASIFVPQGYVVVAPNYALSTPRHAELAVEPGRRPIRRGLGAVRTRATLGIDPNRVAAMGESAGGNLAELLGTDPGPSGYGNCIDEGECRDLVLRAGGSGRPVCHEPGGGPCGGAVPRRVPAAGAGARMPRPPRSIMSHPAIRRCSWCTGCRIRSCRSASPGRWPPP